MLMNLLLVNQPFRLKDQAGLCAGNACHPSWSWLLLSSFVLCECRVCVCVRTCLSHFFSSFLAPCMAGDFCIFMFGVGGSAVRCGAAFIILPFLFLQVPSGVSHSAAPFVKHVFCFTNLSRPPRPIHTTEKRVNTYYVVDPRVVG